MYPYGTGKMSESHPLAQKNFFFSSMTMIISEQFHIDPLEPLGRAGSKSQFDREQC